MTWNYTSLPRFGSVMALERQVGRSYGLSYPGCLWMLRARAMKAGLLREGGAMFPVTSGPHPQLKD